MKAFILQQEIGQMQNFTYLIGCPLEKVCAVVDPGWEHEKILNLAKEKGFKINSILLTHTHFDHCGATNDLLEEIEATVYLNSAKRSDPFSGIDLEGEKVVYVKEGSEFKIGNVNVRCLHTPGHTPEGTCYLVEEKHIFTGDTLFQGSCGRSDLPGSNPDDLKKSLQRLMTLDPDIIVYSGHDYGATKTSTIGFEKENNPTVK